MKENSVFLMLDFINSQNAQSIAFRIASQSKQISSTDIITSGKKAHLHLFSHLLHHKIPMKELPLLACHIRPFKIYIEDEAQRSEINF